MAIDELQKELDDRDKSLFVVDVFENEVEETFQNSSGNTNDKVISTFSYARGKKRFYMQSSNMVKQS